MDESKNTPTTPTNPAPVTNPARKPVAEKQTTDPVTSKSVSKRTILLIVLATVAVTVLLLTLAIGLALSMSNAGDDTNQSSSSTTTTESSAITESSSTTSMASSPTGEDDCNNVTFGDDRMEMIYTYNDCEWSEPVVSEKGANENGPGTFTINQDYIGSAGASELAVKMQPIYASGIEIGCFNTNNPWEAIYTIDPTSYQNADRVYVIQEEQSNNLVYYLGIEKYGPGTVNDYPYLGATNEPADFCGQEEGIIKSTIPLRGTMAELADDTYGFVVTVRLENFSAESAEAAEGLVAQVAEAAWGE